MAGGGWCATTSCIMHALTAPPCTMHAVLRMPARRTHTPLTTCRGTVAYSFQVALTSLDQSEYRNLISPNRRCTNGPQSATIHPDTSIPSALQQTTDISLRGSIAYKAVYVGFENYPSDPLKIFLRVAKRTCRTLK